MSFTLSKIDRIRRLYDVTATLPDGTAATLAGVDVALLPPRTTPTGETMWTAATYSAGTATVLLAGPDADPGDALVVPATGADLWLRVTDNPEIDAERVERIIIS